MLYDNDACSIYEVCDADSHHRHYNNDDDVQRFYALQLLPALF